MLVKRRNLKKTGTGFTSKFVATRPSSYKRKRIYLSAFSQRLRKTAIDDNILHADCMLDT